MTDPRLPRKFIRLVVQMEDTEANRASVQIYRQTIESLHFKSEGNCVMKQEEIAVTHFDDLRNEGATTPEAQP